MAASAQSSVSVHPLLAKLNQGGSSSPLQLAGYVGPSSSGQVRLYSSLSDLTHYLEFDANAVLGTTEAPDSGVPDGGVLIWVDAGTPVRWIREFSAFNDLASALGQTSGPELGFERSTKASRVFGVSVTRFVRTRTCDGRILMADGAGFDINITLNDPAQRSESFPHQGAAPRVGRFST
jgi:hypothetical protein